MQTVFFLLPVWEVHTLAACSLGSALTGVLMPGTGRVRIHESEAQPSSLSSSLPPWKKLAWGWGEGSMRASCGSTKTQIQIPKVTPGLGGQRHSQTARQLGQISDQSVISGFKDQT